MLTLYTRSAKLIYVPLANYIRDLAVEVYKVSLADENTLAFQTFVDDVCLHGEVQQWHGNSLLSSLIKNQWQRHCNDSFSAILAVPLCVWRPYISNI